MLLPNLTGCVLFVWLLSLFAWLSHGYWWAVYGWPGVWTRKLVSHATISVIC